MPPLIYVLYCSTVFYIILLIILFLQFVPHLLLFAQSGMYCNVRSKEFVFFKASLKVKQQREIFFFNTKIFKAVRELTCYQGNWHLMCLVIRLSFVLKLNKVQLLPDLRYVCSEVVACNTIFHLTFLSSALFHPVKRNG